MGLTVHKYFLLYIFNSLLGPSLTPSLWSLTPRSWSNHVERSLAWCAQCHPELLQQRTTAEGECRTPWHVTQPPELCWGRLVTDWSRMRRCAWRCGGAAPRALATRMEHPAPEQGCSCGCSGSEPSTVELRYPIWYKRISFNEMGAL